MDRPDIIKVRDLTTDKVSVVHTNRLVQMLMDVVQKIVDHEEQGRSFRKFRVYETDEDSWFHWNAVKDLAALDAYSQELKLG